MDILLVCNQMLVLLIMMLVGVLCAKVGIIDADGNKKITRLTLTVAQGCMILSSAINVDLGLTLGKFFTILLTGFAMYVVLLLLALLIFYVLRNQKTVRNLFAFMAVFGNVGFMGFPVVRAVYGDAAVFYAALMNIPFNMLAYTIGPIMLRSEDGAFHLEWKVLLNVPLISVLVSILLMLLPFAIPAPIETAVDSMGDMVIPLSMLVIGASLGGMKWKEALGDWRSYAFCLVKLLAAPILVHLSLGMFLQDEVILGIVTILAGMPVAAVSVMLSLQYGRDATLASKTVFITTFLSVVSIPLVCQFLL